jgi:hypothetical protein
VKRNNRCAPVDEVIEFHSKLGFELDRAVYSSRGGFWADPACARAPLRRSRGADSRPSSPHGHQRYDQPEYRPFWAGAAALGLPLSLHTTTRRQGRIRGAGDKTRRDASSRATKAFYPALSLCDLIFSGVFERHPRLTLVIVEFELAWGAAPALHDGLHLPRAPRRGDLPVQGPAVAEAGDGMLASDFFHRIVVLSFQEDAIAGEGRVGVDNMMWGSDYPHSESTFPRSRKILAEILARVPDDEQAKPAPDGDPGDRRRQHRPRVQF